jgi:hypothetical protein
MKGTALGRELARGPDPGSGKPGSGTLDAIGVAAESAEDESGATGSGAVECDTAGSGATGSGTAGCGATGSGAVESGTAGSGNGATGRGVVVSDFAATASRELESAIARMGRALAIAILDEESGRGGGGYLTVSGERLNASSSSSSSSMRGMAPARCAPQRMQKCAPTYISALHFGHGTTSSFIVSHNQISPGEWTTKDGNYEAYPNSI